MYTGALAAYGSLIANNVYPLRLYAVNCTGNENALFKCHLNITSQGVSYEQCAQKRAGVVCQGKHYTNGKPPLIML